jgi:Na+/melibiose symporter-like transporter
MTPLDATLRAFMTLAGKFGPWAALALALVGLLAFTFNSKLDAQTALIVKSIGTHERTVDILRLVCVAVVHTDAEREACRQAGSER